MSSAQQALETDSKDLISHLRLDNVRRDGGIICAEINKMHRLERNVVGLPHVISLEIRLPNQDGSVLTCIPTVEQVGSHYGKLYSYYDQATELDLLHCPSELNPHLEVIRLATEGLAHTLSVESMMNTAANTSVTNRRIMEILNYMGYRNVPSRDKTSTIVEALASLLYRGREHMEHSNVSRHSLLDVIRTINPFAHGQCEHWVRMHVDRMLRYPEEGPFEAGRRLFIEGSL